jgi:hypothetical protein
MQNKALVILIFLAAALPFFGWAGGKSQTVEAPVPADPPAQVEPPPRDNSIVATGSTRSINLSQANVQHSGAALHPITRPILEMIYQSGNDIKTVPYYISDSISLEYSKASQNLEISENGEVILREVSVQDRINIGKETMGTIVAVNYDTEGRMLLAMSFEEGGDAYPLIFREGDKDRIFYLLYYAFNNGEKKIYYGEELYDLLMGDTIPQLKIRFEETREDRPAIRTLQGRRARRETRRHVGPEPAGTAYEDPLW